MHYDFKKAIKEEEKLREEHAKMFKELGFQRKGWEYVMTQEFTLPECVGLTVKVIYILHYKYLEKIGKRDKEKIEIKAVMVPLSFVYGSLRPYITIYQEQSVDYNVSNEVYKDLINEMILETEEKLNAVLHLERIA